VIRHTRYWCGYGCHIDRYSGFLRWCGARQSERAESDQRSDAEQHDCGLLHRFSFQVEVKGLMLHRQQLGGKIAKLQMSPP